MRYGNAVFIAGAIYFLLVLTGIEAHADSPQNITADTEQTLVKNPKELELERFLKRITFDIFTNADGQYGCRGFNVSKDKQGFVTWMTAGHCARSRYVKLQSGAYVKTPEYLSIDVPPDDFLISTRPVFEYEDSPHAILNQPETLNVGEIYYTLGVYQFSPVRAPCLTMLQYTGISKNGYLLFERAWGCNLPHGTSGSPIINDRKELVGVYHGFVNGNLESMYPTEYLASDPYGTLKNLETGMLEFLNINIQQ